MKVRRVIGFSCLCLLLGSMMARGQSPRLEVRVDSRVELLTAAMSQSDWMQARPTWLSPYARQMQEAFFTRRKHPAVQQLNALLRRRVPFEALMAWVLRLGTAPDLEERDALSSGLTEAAGGSENLVKLAAALRLFARDARFMDFFEKQRPFYESLSADYHALLPGETALTRLEEYYGLKDIACTIILTPLFGRFDLAVSKTEPGGTRRFYVPDQPKGMQGTTLVYDPARARNRLFLGIGGALAQEALSELPSTRREAHMAWFAYVAPVLRRHGIRSWDAVLPELLARVNAVRLWLALDDKEAAAQLARRSMDEGFPWLPFLLERAKEYEAQRERYPAFRDFAGRMLAELDTLEPTFRSGEPADLGLADVGLTEEGVPVFRVTPGTPASKAGIQSGDIVTSIAGVRINGSESYLKAWRRWEASSEGERVPFGVLRAGKKRTHTVVMRRAKIYDGFRRKEASRP